MTSLISLSWEEVTSEINLIQHEQVKRKKYYLDKHIAGMKTKVFNECEGIEKLTSKQEVHNRIESLIFWLEEMSKKLKSHYQKRRNMKEKFKDFNIFQKLIFNNEIKFLSEGLKFCQEKRKGCFKLLLKLHSNPI